MHVVDNLVARPVQWERLIEYCLAVPASSQRCDAHAGRASCQCSGSEVQQGPELGFLEGRGELGDLLQHFR